MQFYVRGEERTIHDTQEEVAMLRHRLKSINYWATFHPAAHLLYTFKSGDCRVTHLLIDADTSKQVDWILKRDPLFPYLQYIAQPVISTRDLIEEIQDYLGESYFSDKDLEHFNPHPVVVDQDANYVLVYKQQPPFSPLLSETIQREIYRKTASSQKAHDSSIEISDVNPVGSSVGIHISRVASVSEAKAPVESTSLFPDTHVRYEQLLTLRQASTYCRGRLSRFGVEDITSEEESLDASF